MVINSDCHRAEMLDRQMLGLTTAPRRVEPSRANARPPARSARSSPPRARARQPGLAAPARADHRARCVRALSRDVLRFRFRGYRIVPGDRGSSASRPATPPPCFAERRVSVADRRDRRTPEPGICDHRRGCQVAAGAGGGGTRDRWRAPLPLYAVSTHSDQAITAEVYPPHDSCWHAWLLLRWSGQR